jgi:K+-transporting ATPase ATPase A chain
VINAEKHSHNNLSGKELRFDIIGSSQHNTTAAISSGSSNSDTSKFSPAAKLVFITNILSGNLIFGGAGVGFTNFITMVILTVFIAGLMAGRAPMLYGKRIDTREISFIVFYLVVIQLSIFAFSFICAANSDFSFATLPEVFFNHASAANNNGLSITPTNPSSTLAFSSAFCMLMGRIAQMTVALGIADSLSKKHSIQNKLYDINTGSIFFIILLLFIMVINLTIYLPFLFVWPIIDIINFLG